MCQRMGRLYRVMLGAMAIGVPVVNGTAAVVGLTPCQIFADTPGDVVAGDGFGSAVALSSDGSVVMVGAPLDHAPTEGVGSVYVYRRAGETWIQEARLTAQPAAYGRFGQSIALRGDGTVAVIGAPGTSVDGAERGAAYVFAKTGGSWVQRQQLVGEVLSSAQFGGAVAISADGGTVLVSAGSDNPPSVTPFAWDGLSWARQPELAAAYPYRFTGTIALAAQGNLALITARHTNYPELFSRVDVYSQKNSHWAVRGHIVDPTPDDTESFGYGLALDASGEIAFCGEHEGDGRVNVFRRERGSWRLWAVLQVSSGYQFSDVACASDGTSLLVSAVGFGYQDRAYVFRSDGRVWKLAGQAMPDSLGGFNGRVSLSGDGSLAGVSGPAVRVFELSGADTDLDGIQDVCDDCPSVPDADQADCDADGVADACAIASGRVFDCNGNGIPDRCELSAQSVVPYVIDDGAYDSSVGYTFPVQTSTTWFNQFRVAEGAEFVTGIDIAWGRAPEGRPATIAIWKDPDNDGHPGDAVLLVTAPTVITQPDSGIFITVPIQPTRIGSAGDSFFVGARTMDGEGDYPAGGDLSPPFKMRSWIKAGGDLSVLGQGSPPEPATGYDYAANWMIRARVAANPDCNGNGVLDDCDILTGKSQDLDRNGAPDECEDCDGDGTPDGLAISSGQDQDCNHNRTPDACDIASGVSRDCNGDGVPDECQVSQLFAAGHGPMSPVAAGAALQFEVPSPPPARGAVTFKLSASADLGFASEYISIRVNGAAIGSVFQAGGHDCPFSPDVGELVIDAAVWNGRLGAGAAVVSLEPSAGVEGDLCQNGSHVFASVRYTTLAALDSNGDGAIDSCGGRPPLPGDLNHDGHVTGLDIALLLGSWGACPAPPAACLADLSSDGVVNGVDLAVLLGHWG